MTFHTLSMPTIKVAVEVSMRLHFLAPLFLIPLVASCASAGGGNTGSGSDQGEIAITRQVLQTYEVYLRSRLPLAFAVGADGRGAGYTYCDGIKCLGTAQAENDAISSCNERYGGNGNCTIFARGRGEPRKYRIID